MLSQIQDDVELVVAYCSRALRPSQRRYCTTKREMLAAVAMCIQFRSYLRGAKFTLCTDHKSLVWLHPFKDMEGMMAQWLHTLQQFHFSIIHRPGDDHGNADGLSRAPATPCRQCTRPDCPPVVSLTVSDDQPFDSESTGSSEDADLVPYIQVRCTRPDCPPVVSLTVSDDQPFDSESTGSSEDADLVPYIQVKTGWLNLMMICLNRLLLLAIHFVFQLYSTRILTVLHFTHGLHPELRSLWHHRNNLSLDNNGIIWRKRSSQSSLLQLLGPTPGREKLFLTYHASLFGGHLGRNRTLARLAHRFYWSGMSDDVKE